MWVKLRLSVRQGGKYLYVLSHLIDPRGSIYLFLCLSLLCMCECRDSGTVRGQLCTVDYLLLPFCGPQRLNSDP